MMVYTVQDIIQWLTLLTKPLKHIVAWTSLASLVLYIVMSWFTRFQFNATEDYTPVLNLRRSSSHSNAITWPVTGHMTVTAWRGRQKLNMNNSGQQRLRAQFDCVYRLLENTQDRTILNNFNSQYWYLIFVLLLRFWFLPHPEFGGGRCLDCRPSPRKHPCLNCKNCNQKCEKLCGRFYQLAASASTYDTVWLCISSKEYCKMECMVGMWK